MPGKNARAANPWKILLAGVLATFLVTVLLIGAVVQWFFFGRATHQRTTRRTLTQVHRQDRPAPGAVIIDRDLPLEAPPSGSFVKNAILQSKGAEHSLPGDDLFRDALIPNLEITVASRDLSRLNRNDREYVHATLQEGAVLYTNVAIHLKGGPGSYRPLQDKPAFTLNFDKFAPGQTFHGLKKIHLNNSVQDRSYLAERISRELFEAAGVPVARAGNAKVTLNGRFLGMYVLLEGVNKQFLKRYFSDTSGNIYDGHSQTDVTHDLPTNGGDDPSDKSRLRALARAAREPDLEARMAKLEKTLDVDRFLSFLAMEVMLWHWDGYTMNRNNFRIFEDRASNRLVFLPHGIDQPMTRPPGSLFPRAVGLVSRAILEIPEAREKYLDRVAQLTGTVFREEAISDRIEEVSEKIEAALAETNPEAARTHRERAASLRRRFQQRAAALQGQTGVVEHRTALRN